MFEAMVPDMYVESIYSIDLDRLKQRRMKSIMVDLDNTLVEYTRPDATASLIDWLAVVKEMGFQIIIVSNNTRSRVSKFAQPLGIPYIHAARKPLNYAFKKALKQLGTKVSETVVVGDQLLTDILGGNRMGLYTILVVPISGRENVFTWINRRIERIVFRCLQKRGLLGQEPTAKDQGLKKP